jgi:hypothetical protein
MFGFAGLAQLDISGSWTGNISLIPSVALNWTKLSLTASIAGWDFTSVSTFDSTGFIDQSFSFSGTMGVFAIEGSMGFDPTVPAYEYTDISTSLDFGGVTIGLGVFHGIYPYGVSYFEKAYYPLTWLGLCDGHQTGDALMLYTLSASFDPFWANLKFLDCCEGIEFYSATFGATGLSLCCGVTYDATIAFTKDEGFKSLDIAIKNVFPICCGISFDIGVTYTVTGKTIWAKPKFAGFGDACFELYADLESSGGTNEDLSLNAIRVDGWAITCTLGECNYVKFVSFLSPDNAYLYGYPEGTFEFIELGFCGPGCCGGEYVVEIAVHFTQTTALFGIDHIEAYLEIPLMANFLLTVDFSSSPSLNIGWVFTF